MQLSKFQKNVFCILLILSSLWLFMYLYWEHKVNKQKATLEIYSLEQLLLKNLSLPLHSFENKHTKNAALHLHSKHKIAKDISRGK